MGKELKIGDVSEIFFSKYSLFTLLLIFLHQSVVALSAIFLTRAIENFEAGKDYVQSLLLYIFSMIFPYLPGCLSFITLHIWVVKSHGRYIKKLVSFLQVREDILRNGTVRAAIESAAARSSFMIISDAVSFLHSLTSFVLNSFLSFLVIGLILPGDIFYGYMVSVASCAVLITLTRRFIETAAMESERSFVSYTGALSHIWPNVVLNNKINREAWQRGIDRTSAVYYRKKYRWK